MDRILLTVAIALVYSSASLAAHDDQTTRRVQTNPITAPKDLSAENKPVSWMNANGQFENLDLATETRSINDSLNRNSGDTKTYIGEGVAPLFGTYSVLRTSGKRDGSSYMAFGFNVDELTQAEADESSLRNNNELSFGFGVNNSSSDIQYMMYVDEDNYEISAISLGYIAEF